MLAVLFAGAVVLAVAVHVWTIRRLARQTEGIRRVILQQSKAAHRGDAAIRTEANRALEATHRLQAQIHSDLYSDPRIQRLLNERVLPRVADSGTVSVTLPEWPHDESRDWPVDDIDTWQVWLAAEES